MPRHLDLELLRALVAIADCGGFSRAAEKLHRTQSAVSLQMQRLETTIATPLFRPHGRQRLLTEEGERLVGYARRLLALHDEALGAVSTRRLEGSVRIGSGQAFTEHSLPEVLGRFARLHPDVKLEMRVDANQRLTEAVQNDQLDLALVLQPPGGGGETLRRLPLHWVFSEQIPARQPGEPLPLVLFESPCAFRAMTLETLQRHHLSWRVAYTSPSLPGLLAAVRAGLGVSAQTTLGLGGGVRALLEGDGLPRLPEVDIALHVSARNNNPLVEPLADLMRGVVAEL